MCKKTVLILWAVFSAALMSAQTPWKISPELMAALDADPQGMTAVEVMLTSQVDLAALEHSFTKKKATLENRAYTVITALQDMAAATQGPVMAHLAADPGVDHAHIRSYWITNAFILPANREAVLRLADRADILSLALHVRPGVDDARFESYAPFRTPNGREIAHSVIHATDMWAMGYTGVGRKVLIIDSGIDGEHPALKDNYYGAIVGDNLAWYGPGETDYPFDCSDHGTHVSGTVCGLNRTTHDTIGVAFNARWMGSPAIDGGPDGTPIQACLGGPNSLDALQWAINPDNNALTINDMPDVINNSWGSNPQGNAAACNTVSTSAITALETAGIAVVFSAGNRGTEGASSIGSPAISNVSVVNAFCVGAINAANPSFPRASFSSQGPTICGGTGSLLIKPEVVAPGENVRSSIPGGGYALFSGTSMATPQVSGALLLLKEAFPSLTGTQLKEALYYSATDLGTAGEDNQYGNGLIHVKNAYNYLVNQGFTPVTVPQDRDASVVSVASMTSFRCDTAASPTVTVQNLGNAPMTSARITYSYSDGTTGDFTWTGNLAPNATTQITLPEQTFDIGYHTFELNITEVNGQADYFSLDNSATGSFTILGVDNITTNLVNACTGASALVFANSDKPESVIKWYTANTGGTLVGEGNPLVSPAITANTIYWASATTRGHLGKETYQTGSGLFLQSTAPYLEFEVNYPIVLRSVTVFAAVAGVRSFQLRSEQGSVLNAKFDTLDPGQSVVVLDFPINPGQKYQLGLGSNASGALYHNTTDVSYPYTFNDLVTITGAYQDNLPSNKYFFFYDWVVDIASACPRTAAFVTTSAGNVDANFAASNLLIDLSFNPTVNFTDQSTNATSWLWDFGDGTTSTLKNPSHTYYYPGIYQVSLLATGPDFCSDATSKTLEATGTYLFNVGIGDELGALGKILVYPNPSKGVFQAEFELARMASAEVEVTDVLGKRVLYLPAADYYRETLPLDLSQAAKGVYYLRIKLEDRTLVRKLVKE
ncbi:MAG: S8 family serine peptidase [Bacteroidia bacterium]|nr:S8 family serine peptidase [Bacteroidia bacterium]